MGMEGFSFNKKEVKDIEPNKSNVENLKQGDVIIDPLDGKKLRIVELMKDTHIEGEKDRYSVRAVMVESGTSVTTSLGVEGAKIEKVG